MPEPKCKWCGETKPEHTTWPARSNYWQCKNELALWAGCCFEPEPVCTENVQPNARNQSNKATGVDEGKEAK